ncbi:transglycosylase family protein [Streptomyces sp. NPDC001020]
MLPGNGRHRRPRQAPALIVAAGVTGSAIAIPLLGATSASAADATAWDQVAMCESGGSWSADTGNGRYGGLQLTQADWEKYGGLEYAPRADQASRSQQIAVAERLLAHQGVSAWHTCAPVSGLNKHSGSTRVDTGVADDSSRPTADSTPGHGRSHSHGSSKSAGPSHASPASPSSPSPSSSPAPSTSPSSSAPDSSSHAKPSAGSTANDAGAGDARESRGPSEDATKHGKSDKSVPSGDTSDVDAGRASSGGRHRGGSADEGGTKGHGGDSAGRHGSRDSHVAHGPVDGSYTVRPGDSLSAIADSLDLHGGWGALYDANKKTVGSDPDLIFPGQNLALQGERTEGER